MPGKFETTPTWPAVEFAAVGAVSAMTSPTAPARLEYRSRLCPRWSMRMLSPIIVRAGESSCAPGRQ